MDTATLQAPEAQLGRLDKAVEEALGHVTHLTRDAKELKDKAFVAAEDGLRLARRAANDGVRKAQDLVDDTSYRVKQAPLRSIGYAFAAGTLLGLVVGWVGHRTGARPERNVVC